MSSRELIEETRLASDKELALGSTKMARLLDKLADALEAADKELAAARKTIAAANDWNLEVVSDGEYEPIHVVLHHILNGHKKAGTE